jgi:hypothetical protein
MLAELPDPFHDADIGGGGSFLQACNRQDGVQWTTEHRVMEQLFLLGIATGFVICQLPRWVWPVLPGGMPYYVVITGASVIDEDLDGFVDPDEMEPERNW